MQRDNPKLLTLKDFVMSANQAPDSTSDVLSLLQAFSEFKQGDQGDDCMHKSCSALVLLGLLAVASTCNALPVPD